MIRLIFLVLWGGISQHNLFSQQTKFISDSSLYAASFVNDLRYLMPHANLIFNEDKVTIEEANTKPYSFVFPKMFSKEKKTWVNGTKGNLYVGLRILEVNYTDLLIDIKINNNGVETLEKEIRATIHTSFVLANSEMEDEKGSFIHAYIYTAKLENDETLFFTIGYCSNEIICVRLERIGAAQDSKNISYEFSPLLKSVVNP